MAAAAEEQRDSADSFHLGRGAVLIPFALNHQLGTRDAAGFGGDVPGIEARVEPGAGPFPEETLGVMAVVALEPLPHARMIGCDGCANAGAGDGFDEDMGGFGDDAVNVVAGLGGVEESDRAAVGVADENRRGDVVLAEDLAEHIGFAMEVVEAPGGGEGRRLSMALAVIEQAAAAGSLAEAGGKIAPQGDATQPMVEKDEGGGRACPWDVFHVQRHPQIIIGTWNSAFFIGP